MTERGPDSAGLAVYTAPVASITAQDQLVQRRAANRLAVRCPSGLAASLEKSVERAGSPSRIRSTQAVLTSHDRVRGSRCVRVAAGRTRSRRSRMLSVGRHASRSVQRCRCIRLTSRGVIDFESADAAAHVVGAHPHGDRVGRDARRGAHPFTDWTPISVSGTQRFAVEPTIPCVRKRLEPRRHPLRNGQRHRSRLPLLSEWPVCDEGLTIWCEAVEAWPLPSWTASSPS